MSLLLDTHIFMEEDNIPEPAFLGRGRYCGDFQPEGIKKAIFLPGTRLPRPTESRMPRGKRAASELVLPFRLYMSLSLGWHPTPFKVATMVSILKWLRQNKPIQLQAHLPSVHLGKGA